LLVRASPFPLLLYLIGLVVSQVEESELARALGAGASAAASLLLFLRVVRIALSDELLSQRLQGMQQSTRRSLRLSLRVLEAALVPLVFFVFLFAKEGLPFPGTGTFVGYSDGFGRLCFLGVTGAVALISTLLVFHPGMRAAQLAIGGAGGDSTRRMRVWGIAACCVALLLALSAALGFYVTALAVAVFTFQTAVVTLATFLVARLFRAVFHQPIPDTDTAPARDADPQDEVRQTRQFFRFAVSLVWIFLVLRIWTPFFPALSFLDRVQVFPRLQILAAPEAAPAALPSPDSQRAAATAAAGSASAQVQVSMPGVPMSVVTTPVDTETGTPVEHAELTLYDLMWAAITVVVTVLLVRDIPGLLNQALRWRFNLQPGARYAATTITRYLLVMAGVVAVSVELGLQWSRVQWLAAALTFGVGFGLQEIFANFASGIIILLDRSIRVGDAVTVGEHTGIVSRIQTRSTTITLWDHSEMVVPNKDFITNKLVNWTLSRPETRIDVKVGVAYHSDVDLVRSVLLELASSHPAVLKEPPADVYLMEFGDNAIQFELRVFAPYEYGRLIIRNELQMALVREFRRHNIAIAFPQLDVHFDAAPPVQSPRRETSV
jgi:small-conductance mechanosensitive channel